MNYSRWKNVFAVARTVGGVVAAVGLVVDPLVVLAGGVVVALGQLGLHLSGAAEERWRADVVGARGAAQLAGSVERGQAIVYTEPILGADAHSEIDEAFEYVKQGRPEVTIDLLEKIRKRRWGRLDDRERYRVLANIGNAKLARQDKAGAAANYLKAVAYQPSDEDARSLEALAHLLLGERDKAHNLAEELCGDHPNLGRAHSVRIRTAPTDMPYDELESSVPIAVRGHPEVALALHDRAVAEDRLVEAEQALRRCPEAEGWEQFKLALGSTLLQQALAEVRVSPEGPIIADRQPLTEAVRLFSEALEQIPQSDPEGLTFGAYLNRGTAQRLLGEIELARDDFHRAREQNLDDERVAIAVARSAYPDGGDLDGAIATLDRHLEDNDSSLVELLLTEFLRQRGTDLDLKRAAGLLEGLLPALKDYEEAEQRADLVEILTDIYLRTDRGDEAVDLVADLEEELGGARRHAILGNVFRRLGRTEEAVSRATAARASLGASTDWNDVRRVALLLESLDRFGEAFELWRRIVEPDFLSRETHHLLYCAKEYGEHEFLVDFCQQLRTAGHYDHNTLRLEVETLVRYSEYPRARDAFLDYLRVRPEDKVARLNLTILALQQGWENLVENELSRLPTVEELKNAGIGEQAVKVLRAGPDPTQALDYGYALYRRFPDEAEASRALIVAVLAPGRAGLQIETPHVAAAGTAVRYREADDDGEGRWLVIEDAENPSVSRDEYAPSSTLAQAIAGKRVEEQFAFPPGFRERSGTVLEIQDKRIFRAQQLMLEWRERFPDEPFVEAVPIGAADTPTPDFSEVIKVLEAHGDRRQRLKSAYEEGKIPISTLAHFRGITVFETVRDLAISDLPVRVCRGRTEDFEKVIAILDGATSAVLEPSALASLALLEEVNLLASLPFRCLVTEGTLQEMRNLARDEPPHGKGGMIGVDGGRPWIHEITEEEETAKQERLREVIAAIEQDCEVIGGSDLARVEPGLRRQITECVAQGSAEAVAAASLRGAVLWTDDELLRMLVKDMLTKDDLPAPRVWTQAVVFWMHARGLVDSPHRSRVTARMLRFGYIFTSTNAQAILDTCEAAAWQTDDPDLTAILADFGNPGWDFSTALGATAQTIARVWREAPLEEHARAVTGRLLVHLADRDDHEKIVRSLLGNVDTLLGLALPRAVPLRRVLTAFLKGGGPSL